MEKEHYLPNKARKVLRALIEVVKPRKPGFDPPVEDYMLDFLDNFYSYFPLHMKIGFPAGLYLLEYGTIIFNARTKPFTRLSMPERTAYVKSWIVSNMSLRRDLIKGVKGVCLTAYYSHPEVMAHIGYDLEGHIARVNAGEPCDKDACDYFRKKGYDENNPIPYPAYDHVDLICHDTPPTGSGE
jgi:hypothetical protein